jgi:hypothetical protein
VSEQQEVRRRGNILFGLGLIVLGALFMASRLFNFNPWEVFWPFFIIIPGSLFFVGMVAGGKTAGPLAIPGSIVTMTGLILLFQAVFDAYETWAYVWLLIFPTSVGLGLIINGTWSANPRLVRKGVRLTTTGLIICLLLGAFLELAFDLSDNPLSNVLWPALLIGAGLYLLRRRPPASPNGRTREPVITVEREPEPPASATTTGASAPTPPKAARRPITPKPPEPPRFEPIDPERGKRRRKPANPDDAPKT